MLPDSACIFYVQMHVGPGKCKTLEVDDGFSNGQISLNSPRQVKELRGDEFEDLVHIYVVGRTWKEECCIHGPRIYSCLSKMNKNEKGWKKKKLSYGKVDKAMRTDSCT